MKSVVSKPLHTTGAGNGDGLTVGAGLAIQETCRRMRADTINIGTWLPLVTLRFKQLNSMIELLLTWSDSEVKLLRRIESPLGEYWENFRGPIRLGFGVRDATQFLPGLQLDQLLVDATQCVNEDAWFSIHTLIGSGKGWRTAVIWALHEGFLIWECNGFGPECKIWAQPASWDAIVKQRDGPASGARVEIFQESFPGSGQEALESPDFDNLTLHGFQPLVVPQMAIHASDGEQSFEQWAKDRPDKDSSSSEFRCKLVVMIIHRGRDADVTVPAGEQHWYGRRWEDIKGEFPDF